VAGEATRHACEACRLPLAIEESAPSGAPTWLFSAINALEGFGEESAIKIFGQLADEVERILETIETKTMDVLGQRAPDEVKK
jgi:hypothetical protein